MAYFDVAGAMGRDSDQSQVFYSSKQLHVTGMKIAAGSGVYPISTVASVEVHRRSPSFLMEALKAGALGLAMVVIGAMVGRSFAASSTRTALWLVGIALLGFLVVIMACLMIVQFFKEKILHVRFVSGDNMKVASWDEKVVWAMHEAIDKAMTYNMNQASHPSSVADEIAKLSELRSRGAITDEDWSRAKDLFLGKQHSAQEQAIAQLQQLFELRKSGVLTESEFNMKKWDVLSRV